MRLGLLGLATVFALLIDAPVVSAQATTVDCDQGGDLAEALALASAIESDGSGFPVLEIAAPRVIVEHLSIRGGTIGVSVNEAAASASIRESRLHQNQTGLVVSRGCPSAPRFCSGSGNGGPRPRDLRRSPSFPDATGQRLDLPRGAGGR